jgi:hypothetical protein
VGQGGVCEQVASWSGLSRPSAVGEYTLNVDCSAGSADPRHKAEDDDREVGASVMTGHSVPSLLVEPSAVRSSPLPSLWSGAIFAVMVGLVPILC